MKRIAKEKLSYTRKGQVGLLLMSLTYFSLRWFFPTTSQVFLAQTTEPALGHDADLSVMPLLPWQLHVRFSTMGSAAWSSSYWRYWLCTHGHSPTARGSSHWQRCWLGKDGYSPTAPSHWILWTTVGKDFGLHGCCALSRTRAFWTTRYPACFIALLGAKAMGESEEVCENV